MDFDGTLVDDGKWPEMGDWLPGAVEGLRRLSKVFDEVVIWTCRTAEFETDEKTPRENWDQIQAINAMLDGAELPDNVYVWAKPYKPMAEFYLDNRAIRFNGNWGLAIEQMNYIENPRTKIDWMAGPNPPWDEYRIEEPWPPIRGDEHVEGHKVRTFSTGATRDTDDGKYDYEGFLSPLVLRRYAEYMHQHRIQSDGTLRASDNWQKGIPLDAYMKSGWRHFMDWWAWHRAPEVPERAESLEDALCALIFNAMGYLHELQRGTLAP